MYETHECKNLGIPPLTRKQGKSKNSSVGNHLLFCNHSACYDDFSVLTCENKKLKKSLLIMKNQNFLHRNFTSALLYLIGKP